MAPVLYMPGLLIQQGENNALLLLFFLIAYAFGGFCVWQAAGTSLSKVFLLLGYLGCMGFGALFISFSFVCSVYHRCL